MPLLASVLKNMRPEGTADDEVNFLFVFLEGRGRSEMHSG